MLLISLSLSGCLSAFTVPTAMMVSATAEHNAKVDKRFTYADACMFGRATDPFSVTEAIVAGTPVTKEYSAILGPSIDPNAPPPQPHEVAYAFFVIAEQMDDIRTEITPMKGRLSPYFEPEELKALEEHIKFRYLRSYLFKCFEVPPPYLKPSSVRDVLGR